MSFTRRGFGALASGALALAAAPLRPALAAADDLPNVFFSPHGQPFRAPPGAPYPVVDWFAQADKNGDGKLTLQEFVADAGAFFDLLDLDGDHLLNSREIAIYERRIAPEILGLHVRILASERARVWRAQYAPEAPMEQAPWGYTGPGQHDLQRPNSGVLPDDVAPNDTTRPESKQEMRGAAPYGLLPQPEPVTAADPDYLFRNVVRKQRFLAFAQDNFTALDDGGKGYLTLAGLPKSSVQRMIEQAGGARRTARS